MNPIYLIIMLNLTTYIYLFISYLYRIMSNFTGLKCYIYGHLCNSVTLQFFLFDRGTSYNTNWNNCHSDTWLSGEKHRKRKMGQNSKVKQRHKNAILSEREREIDWSEMKG